ncbi:MAG: hypothetical protein COA76_05795 [Moritella sp.]|uniref:hypothetical protein n=1 Tax=Moritella sp. TaxID=78556 RepID=UPI000C107AE1|nr:hypothetical protein [Moritella sp.]MBL1417608.1 hypothetical protein [Moritella sp.]PHR88939.1 MAG: hypothetical protein COA76_05795 [Moritella sp.]
MKTELKFRNVISIFFECVFVGFFYGGILLGGGGFLLLESIAYEFPIKTRQIIAMVLGVLIAGIYAYFRIRQYREKECWSLSGNILSCGNPVNYEVDLSAIEKAIPALPKPSWNNFLFGGKLKFKEHATVEAIYTSTLILKLDSSTYLPLYLFNLDGGLGMMNEITKKIADKIEEQYKFSPAEVKALKPRKLNTVVKL